jgi:hypothetical protein
MLQRTRKNERNPLHAATVPDSLFHVGKTATVQFPDFVIAQSRCRSASKKY